MRTALFALALLLVWASGAEAGAEHWVRAGTDLLFAAITLCARGCKVTVR